MKDALLGAATFVAAGVEWVEALTIVLAVAIIKGWRSALAGAGGAFVVLVGLVIALGIALTTNLPLALAQTAIGSLLLLFGLRWLHKAVLRSAGRIPLHDEAEEFVATEGYLQTHGGRSRFDWLGVSTAFSGVFLEGLEVVFIVVALGGVRGSVPAAAGAGASLAAVGAAGAVFHRPLTHVPENALKYAVGIMLTTFGTFFVGEGLGVRWFVGDATLLLLAPGYLVVSLGLVLLLRQPSGGLPTPKLVRPVVAVVTEVWSLFVADAALAAMAVVAVLAAALLIAHGAVFPAALVLPAGVVAALLTGVAARRSG